MKKNIIVLILAVLLSVPFFISAQTVQSQDQITQQLIQTLTQMILKLEQEINAILAARSAAVKVAPLNISTVNTPLKGTLDLVQNVSYLNQSAVPSQTNFKLADFSLTNNTSEPVNINKIEADLYIGSNLYVANFYVTNLYIAYGNNKTSALNTVSGNNYWAVNFQLPVGQTINLSVYGDISSSTPINSIINSSVSVFGTSAVSATGINTNSGSVLAGPNITFTTGSLSVVEDGTTPTAKIYAFNQRVVAGKFQFTSTADIYNISELKFIIPSKDPSSVAGIQPPPPSVADAILSDTSTQVLLSSKPAQVTYDGSEYILDFNVNIPVSPNSSRFITLSYDLSAIINPYSTNLNVAPVLAYIKATNSAGSIMDGAASNYNDVVASYKGISLPSAGISVNGLYVFKSIPIFTTISSGTSATNGSAVNLYTFSIKAAPAGNISIKQLTFSISITDPNIGVPSLTNFTLLKGNNDYTGAVSIGTVVNYNYIGLINGGGIGVGPANTVAVTFNREEIIAAGNTQTYTLRAVAKNFVPADSISTSVQSDTGVISGGSYLGASFSKLYYGLSDSNTSLSAVNNYNLLWSDLSATDHNDSINSSSKDWYNGFGVLNLPLS